MLKMALTSQKLLEINARHLAAMVFYCLMQALRQHMTNQARSLVSIAQTATALMLLIGLELIE